MKTIIEYLMYHTIEYYALIGIIGLIIGSFLNVIIHRLPIILSRQLKAECYDYLNLRKPKEFKSIEKLGLLFPGSRCPKCKHKIAAWQNIPLISYVILAGKCFYCKKRISFRYPAIEALTTVLSIIVAWHFGVTVLAILALILTWVLIAQTFIDIDHKIIPDELTIPFIWLGLIFSYYSLGFVNLNQAFLGAVWGYASLFIIYETFKLVTKKDGMGFGDFKLFAMLGAWLGWQMLPQILLNST